MPTKRLILIGSAIVSIAVFASAPAALAQSGTLSAFQSRFGGAALSGLAQPFNAATNTNLQFTDGLIGTTAEPGASSREWSGGAGDNYYGVGQNGANTAGGLSDVQGGQGVSRQNSGDAGPGATLLNGKVNLNGGQ